MKKKNELAKLAGSLSRGKGTTGGVRAPSIQLLQDSVSHASDSTLRPGKTDGLRPRSLGSGALNSSGLHFGAPSQKATTSHSSGSSAWTHLISRAASGGVSSAFGGGLLSAAGGLGGLISGLVSLFGGGKKTPPPLQLFQLPGAQNESISVGSRSAAETYGGPVYQTSQGGAVATGNDAGHPALAHLQSAEVAQAVKLAILNSSSLSDVIAEL